MKWSRILIALAWAAALPAHAQGYPTKPVRVIVPYAAGGNTDFVMRQIGAKLAPVFGHQVVVENRPGGGTNIGSEIVAKAAPDGYLLLMAGAANAINMTLFANPPYQTLRDLTPIVLCTTGANVLTAHPSVPAKNLKELIALARARPGKLNFGSSGIGSGTHYGGELFNLSAGIKAVHVPYKGTPEVITDTISGRMHYAMSPLLAAVPHVRAGRLTAVGVTSPKRLPMLPDVPTIAEAALPGFEYLGWFGFIAPARVPPAVMKKLNAEIVRIVAMPDIQERIARDGSVAVSSTPEAFDKLIRDEIATRTKVFKAAGAKAN